MERHKPSVRAERTRGMSNTISHAPAARAMPSLHSMWSMRRPRFAGRALVRSSHTVYASLSASCCSRQMSRCCAMRPASACSSCATQAYSMLLCLTFWCRRLYPMQPRHICHSHPCASWPCLGVERVGPWQACAMQQRNCANLHWQGPVDHEPVATLAGARTLRTSHAGCMRVRTASALTQVHDRAHGAMASAHGDTATMRRVQRTSGR